MRNKIDILRALCFTKEDLNTITNLGDMFTDLEIDFMVEFKKVFELGEEYLKKFIDKIDKEGEELKIWDVEYYVEHLFNSPWRKEVEKLAKDKKYFVPNPNSMGTFGNLNITRHNVSLQEGDIIPSDVSTDIFVKAPDFIRDIISESHNQTEQMFRSSMYHAVYYDNTLPLVDKKTRQRSSSEPSGGLVKQPNGNYCIRDVAYRLDMQPIREQIFEKVKEKIEEENYRLFLDRKYYNSFEPSQNTAYSSIFEFDKKIVEKVEGGEDKEEIIKMDIMGDPFDKRDSKIKINAPEKNKEFLLNTIEGQLGN